MLLQIAAIALFDSLNILTLAVAAFLLGTPRPVPRALAYVVGTSIGYFTAGAVLLLGWSFLLDRLVTLLDAGSVALLQIATGIVLTAAGIHAIRRPSREVVFKPPQRISPAATFVLGAVIGLLYAPTDPRHNAGIAVIVDHTASYSAQLSWLVWYNMFYILPLLAMVLARVVWPGNSHQVFGWMTATLGNFFHKWLPYLIVVAGIALVIHGAIHMVAMVGEST